MMTWSQPECSMASAQNSTQDPQMNVVQHNHIVIKYQQPPDLAIIKCVLEILIGVTRTFSQRNPAQIQYTWDYINQIIPLLQTLYSQSAQQVLVQGGIPPLASNTIYLPPTHKNLQNFLVSWVVFKPLPLGWWPTFSSKKNMEQSTQPSTSFQTNKIIEVEMCNIYSVNKVLLQQILETIRQVTKMILDRNPQQFWN